LSTLATVDLYVQEYDDTDGAVGGGGDKIANGMSVTVVMKGMFLLVL